jgi:hypothetical protein
MAITVCSQYCLATGATQGNIAYTQNVDFKIIQNVSKNSSISLPSAPQIISGNNNLFLEITF